MPTLHHEIRIDASPDAVWSVVANLEAVKHYSPTVTDARLISQVRKGIGASRRCELKGGGYVCERVTGWEARKAVTIELYEHPWPINTMSWRTEVSPDGEGTRVVQDTEYEMMFGVLGALLSRFVMQRQMDRGLAEVFARLKRYVETDAPAPATA